MRWLMVMTLASLPMSALAENNTALLAKNVLIGSVSTDAVGDRPRGPELVPLPGEGGPVLLRGSGQR